MSLDIAYPGYRTGWPYATRHRVDGEDITVWDGSSYEGNEYPASPSGKGSVVGAGTRHPFGFTFSEFVNIVWRVREVSITHSWYSQHSSIHDEPTDPPQTHTVIGTPSSFLDRASIGNGEEIGERRLIARTAYFDVSRLYGAVTVANYGPTVDGANDIYADAFFNFNNTLFYGNKYWPSMTFLHFPVNGSFRVGPILQCLARKYNPTAPFATNATLILDLGNNTEIKTTPFFMVTHPVLTNYAASGNVTIKATKFWGYGGKFDTTTGERT